MPIYAYRCEACGHQQDVLQKLSDAPLTVCTACGAAAFKKQVTAAGFQLKGSGWYVTDFRNNGAAPAAAKKSEGELAAGAPAVPPAAGSSGDAGAAASTTAAPAASSTPSAPPPASTAAAS